MKKLYSLTFILLLLFALNKTIAAPIAASCTQYTSTLSCCGFGILNVTFNTINNTTVGAAIDGYQDYSSAINTNVLVGQTYTLSVNVSGSTGGKHNVKAWIDYNNDGTLDSIAELVYSVSSVTLTSGVINIPAFATLNTQLRMRVSADYDMSPPFGPCKKLEYGQAEDYAITILTNPNPPNVSFNASPTTTCDGVVSFTDASLNVPTSWLWKFGDGAGSTSTQQNPVHTYTVSGTYTVKLKATNTNGNDEDSIVNCVTVTLGAGPIAPSCTPPTLLYHNQFGITRVNFGSINKTSADASEGYKDFSCTNSASFYAGSYPITIETGSVNPHDVKVWIDFNNDGVFNTSNEQVFTSTNQTTHTGNITIPGTAIGSTPLRMRVIADYVGNPIGPCTSPAWGQAEDYTIKSNGFVGIKKESSKPVLNVFPNPANGLVTIEHSFGDKENIAIFISDLLGREVQKINSQGTSKQTVDLSSQPKGIYFIELVDGKNRLVKKIILQ